MIATASNASLLSRLFVLFVVVDLSELGIDDVFLLAVTTASSTSGVAGLLLCGLLLCGLLIHCLTELHRGLRQSIGLGRDGVGVAALEVRQGVLNCASITLANF